MNDFVLYISCHPDLEDIVHGRLFLTRSTGSDSSRDGVICAYFDAAADRDAAAESLRDLPVVLRTETRERADWLRLYQQSLQPLFIGKSFVVAPDPALIPAGEERHPLVIPQEQAFGTGSHQSTALCIELLEDLHLRGKSALDIGSGSGILALAMLRLGARNAIAFDVELDAFRPLRENRKRNGIKPAQMPVFIGTVDALCGGRFDVITMNILPEVILPLLPRVVAHMREVLIVSGILLNQRDDLLAAAGELRITKERQKGEWWAASFRR